MSIEKIIAELGKRDAKSLKGFLANAESILRKNSGDPEALRLRSEVLDEWARRHSDTVDGWTSGSQGDPRSLKRNGCAVASVHRLETHRSDNDGVYAVIVKGHEFRERFRHVDDARAAAEEELKKT